MTDRKITHEFYQNLFESIPPQHQPTYLLPPFNSYEYNLGVLLTRGPNETRDMSRIAIITESEQISYRELDESTSRLGNYLIQLGIQSKGDRIVFLTDDIRSKYGYLVLLATLKVNALLFTPNPLLINLSHTEKLVDLIEPSLILIGRLQEGSDYSKFVAKYAENNPQKVYSVLSDDDKYARLRDVEIEEMQSFSLMIKESKGLTPGYFCHTSGSTSLPKICVHFHSTTYYTMMAFLNFFPLAESDRFLIHGSHGGTFGIVSNFCAFLLGATIILDIRTPLKQQFEMYKPSVFLSGPSYYHSLLKEEHFTFPTSIRYLLSGAEKLQPSTFDMFRKKYNLTINEMVGGSELCFVIAANPLGQAKSASCGKKLSEYDLKILDENLLEIEDDRKGILFARGPANCFYFKNPSAQAGVVMDGWYCTNDVFSRDADGYYYCYGREDDIIIVDGFNISPVVVEELLLNHPYVFEAGVVGIYDESVCSSKVLAGIVLSHASYDNEHCLRELLTWINTPSRVPVKSQITALFSISSLPRGGNGNKLNRKWLANELKKKMKNGQ